MARVFLSNETYNAATDNADILGAAGSEQVNVLAGTTGLNIASSVERVDLSGNIADYTFSSFGAAMTIRDSAGNIVGTVSDSGGKSVVFADGALSAVYAGTTLSLGGVALTGTAAPITPAAADIDAGTVSEAVGSGTGSTGGTGNTQAFTVGADAFSGTAFNDTYTAAAGTFEATDAIIDGSTTDNDSLSVVLNANTVKATISGVENITFDLDVFDGADATVDATNISGATLTLFSDKLGFNGTGKVDAAGDNNVTAGANIDTLTIAGLEAGVVNTGSADTVSVTTAAGTDVANLTVNGDLELTVVTATDLVVTATSASVVTAAAGAFSATDVTLNGNVTLQGKAADFTTNTITGGSLRIDDSGAGTLDAENFTVSSIEVADATALAVTKADGQTVILTVEDADLTVSGTGAAGSTVSVTLSADQSGAGAKIDVNSTDTSTITLASAVETITQLTIDNDATVAVSGDVTITKLIATAVTDTVTFTGSGNVDVTGDGATDVATVTSSALTGNLTYAHTTDKDISVTAGSGDDDITVAVNTNDAVIVTGDGTNTVTNTALVSGTLSVTGGSGSDTVDLSGAVGVNGATIAGELGGGDDTVSLGDQVTNATIAIDFGDGTDTLSLVDTKDYSDATSVTFIGLEIIDMNGSAKIGADVVSGESYIIRGGGVGATLTVEASVTTGETIDISSLVFDGTIANGADTTAINAGGATGGDTIIGNAATVDTITLTGNNTADSVDVSTSTEDVLDVIVGFVSADDSITFGGPAGSAANYTEGTNANFAAALAAAEAAFDGTVVYSAQDDGNDTYVFYDADGDGTADAVVTVGTTVIAAFEFGDIA